MKAMRMTIFAPVFSVFFLITMALSAAAVELGERAPDFELASTKDGKFKLSNLQGKKNLLIQFYVLDFTPT